jgi:hypothetical protein
VRTCFIQLQLGWFLKIKLSVLIGLNSDPYPRGELLWASRAFDRSPPNLRVRRMKFLFEFEGEERLRWLAAWKCRYSLEDRDEVGRPD